MAAQVQPFFHADSNTWSYLVSDPGTKAALLIDPVLDYEPRAARIGTSAAQALLAEADAHGLDLRWVLETHAHADHLSAAAWLRGQRPGLRVGIGERIRAVQAHFGPVFELAPGECAACFDQLFADGDRLALGALQIEVLATPGHTPDGVSYLIGDALFVGDSLFLPDAGTGRCDFPGGSASALFRSIQRLYALPDETRVFVGHDYGPNGRAPACESRIGEQKRGNLHAREGVDEAGFVAMREARDATLPLPALILPSLQVNLRAGELPAPQANGRRYLRLPLDAF